MKKGLLGLGIAGMLLAACGNSQANIQSSSTTAAQAQASTGKLVLSTFALSQDVVEKDIIAPFKTAKGVEVTLEVGNATERLTKISNGNSGIDAIELSQNNATQGTEKGLFETLTEKEVPNITELSDGAKEVLKNGGGVPYSINSIGIIYNKEKVGREINTWEDLWAGDLKGKVAIPDITTTGGPLFLHVAADYAKTPLTQDNGKAAFDALTQLKPNIVKTYTKSSDLANMFQAGEISVAVIVDFAVKTTQKAEPNAVYVVPQSGTYANYNTINVVKGAANKQAAFDFVNHRISKENQTAKAQATSLAETPVNKNVTLTPEQSVNMTYGDVAKRAKTVDFKIVNEQLKAWIEQWNKILNQ